MSWYNLVHEKTTVWVCDSCGSETKEALRKTPPCLTSWFCETCTEEMNKEAIKFFNKAYEK